MALQKTLDADSLDNSDFSPETFVNRPKIEYVLSGCFHKLIENVSGIDECGSEDKNLITQSLFKAFEYNPIFKFNIINSEDDVIRIEESLLERLIFNKDQSLFTLSFRNEELLQELLALLIKYI